MILSDLDKPKFTVPYSVSFVSSNGPAWTSLWRSTWQWPIIAPTLPPTGSGVALDNTSAGAFPMPDLAAGQRPMLTQWTTSFANSRTRSLHFVDRLVHTSGLDATSTAVQTVNTVALPTRAGSGDGVMIGIEQYSGIGTTVVTITVNYTDSAGNPQSGTVQNLSSNFNIQGFLPIMFTGGATGVQSVQSVQLSASTGIVGNLGITLFKPYVSMAEGQQRRGLELGLPIFPADSCMSFLMVLDTVAAAFSVLGEMQFMAV